MSMSKYQVLISGVCLINGRIKNIDQAMPTVCEEVKFVIEQMIAFADMSCSKINMVFRWGEERIEEREIGLLHISKRSLDVVATISLAGGRAIEKNPEQHIKKYCCPRSLSVQNNRATFSKDPTPLKKGFII